MMPVFVYGTLCRHCPAKHRSYLGCAVYVVPATVGPARLHHMPGMFPALEADPRTVIAEGSADYGRDLALAQAGAEAPGFAPKPCASHPWLPRIAGEYVLLPPDPALLDRLDTHEGFMPGDKGSFYRRDLLPVTLEDGTTVPAWTYTLPRAGSRGFVPLLDDRWTPALRASGI
jgi:gamma-glutamylcyclotransferase (GGCT)/AIG2-like uncharacterized protein YtfP